MSDVITLSSDDEFEGPPIKKMKIRSENTASQTLNALQKLDKLKEISMFQSAESQSEGKSGIKNGFSEVGSLTIIIEADEAPKGRDRKYMNNNVVVIEDNVDEETPVTEVTPKFEVELKENTANDCMVIVDDAPEDSEDVDRSLELTDSSADDQNQASSNNQDGEALAEIYSRPSTSKASEAHRLLDQFLEVCAASIKGSKYEDRVLPKFPKMRKYFNNCDNIHNETSLKRTLQEHINTAKFTAADAVVSFQRIYSYLLDNINGASMEIPEDNFKKIFKLERTCKLLMKRLKKLEESEVDFDDDNDSTYIQQDRFTERLIKVYNKLCQVIKRNPHSGRLLYDRVHFVSSKYDEINRAISKSYKNNKFPTYFDIEKCIRNCVSKTNLALSESEIKEESKHCFVKLGNLLQLRRKKELYEVHCGFITLNEDPASTDQELRAKLHESSTEGEKKMKEVVEKFAKLQDSNVPVEQLSEDSDDSHHKNSDSDE